MFYSLQDHQISKVVHTVDVILGLCPMSGICRNEIPWNGRTIRMSTPFRSHWISFRRVPGHWTWAESNRLTVSLTCRKFIEHLSGLHWHIFFRWDYWFVFRDWISSPVWWCKVFSWFMPTIDRFEREYVSLGLSLFPVGPSSKPVEHFLLRCEQFDKERDQMRRKIGMEGMRVEKLLGDSKIIKYTIKYIESTKRFKF